MRGCERGRKKKKKERNRRKQNRIIFRLYFVFRSVPVSTSALFFSLLAQLRKSVTMSLSQLRTAILRHASVGPSTAALSAVAAAAVGIAGRSSGAAAGTTGSRGFASSASTYLDKDAVTSRVLSVVKAFDKVDPGKVRKTKKREA